MKSSGFVPTVLLILLLLSGNLQSKEKIAIAIWGPMIKNLNHIMSNQGKTVYEITDLKTKGADRNTASFVILMQAVKTGGMGIDFELIHVPNPKRGISMVRQGQAVSTFTAVWSSDFRHDDYKSSTIIARGETYKGIYCLKKNKKLLKIKSQEDLKNFSCISSKNWTVDWKTLKQLKLKRLHSVHSRNMMFNMIRFRNYDFALIDFPSNPEDLSVTILGTTLIPVPGFKIALDDSRHFMVSKRHPSGKKFYKALEKGLKVLKRREVLRKLFTDVKVYRQDLARWKVISVK